ncbi:L,D-transpeptidase family protein [Krasilnikoviella flava]|uniref:Putative peptidoglycan binding domain-containing protein n=1 Tax=Krasilnikoviella flava TaxID=526729 RepID=A0A1T5J9I2_9MICO|nr:L,D-transpeptidase family protein [Krasilnikoviella flava]SKC47976.1 Putative peptidoglycan binding domain-containing protein [Krasilnikoviella flava]
MRTVPSLRRRKAAAVLGVPVVLALALAGCAPLSGDTEPQPGAAPTASVSPSDDAGPASDGAQGRAEQDAQEKADQEAAEREQAERQAEQDAADEAAAKEQEAAEKKAAEKAEKEAEQKAAEEAAEKEQAEQEAAEKKAAEERDKMLEYGDSGDRVVALQERLQELGYFLQDADGSFGPATQQAVWALQKAAGQYRDGVVGPKTQDALDDGVRPAAHSSSGKVVEIDLDRQLLMTVEDGKVTRIINASSGNGDTYEAKGRSYHATTPRGSYAVYMERNGMHESTLELGSMYRPKYFSGGYAVHGSGSIPPYPASHGCVRVSNSAISWLWDSWGMPKGTPVVLY